MKKEKDLGEELDIAGGGFEAAAAAVVATRPEVFHIKSGNVQVLDQFFQQTVGEAEIAGSGQIAGLIPYSIDTLRWLLCLSFAHP